jgi:hypothetical protein
MSLLSFQPKSDRFSRTLIPFQDEELLAGFSLPLARAAETDLRAASADCLPILRASFKRRTSS